MTEKTYGHVLEHLQEIDIIDTHEHIMAQSEVLQEPLHLFRVFENSYARLDFISAGMPPEAWEMGHPQEIWQAFDGFQDRVGYTCYFSNIIRALQDLYGLEGDRITAKNWQDLSEKIVQAYQRDDWYEHVLKEKAGIKTSFLDRFWAVERLTFDTAHFVPVLRTNPLILGRAFVSQYPRGKVLHSTVEDLSREWNMGMETFESYLELIDTAITRNKEHKAPAVKIGTAYERTLHFENTPSAEAARLYKKPPADLTPAERKKLQDFMAHYIIQKATKEGLPVQIHTGILARNANILNNSNPEHLNNLFLEYPETKFALLHFSFPYTGQVLSLAKMFPNVVLDFCWVPLLSSRVAIRAIDEFLDLVPYNKLMWGGDSYRVEEAYGASCLAREVVGSVLADRIDRGDMDLERAMTVARAIFCENAREFFALDSA